MTPEENGAKKHMRVQPHWLKELLMPPFGLYQCQPELSKTVTQERQTSPGYEVFVGLPFL